MHRQPARIHGERREVSRRSALGPRGHSVTVTVWPAVSEPVAGEMDSSLAGTGEVMLNFTGPPTAVSVNDPVYGPPAAGWLSRTSWSRRR